MARQCCRHGCNKQLSRPRVNQGLRTCASHGRSLAAGHPRRQRKERRLCRRPGCGRRLSAHRLRAGALLCAVHGGHLPACTPIARRSRLTARDARSLERTIRLIRSWPSSLPKSVLLQALHQLSGDERAPAVLPPDLDSRGDTDLPARRRQPAEVLLLNTALRQRIAPAVRGHIGWLSEWSPERVLLSLQSCAMELSLIHI